MEPRVLGVCPVIETPFMRDERTDPAAMAHLISALTTTGVRSVMYAGFASEMQALSDAERDEMTRVVIHSAHAGGALAVASVSDHATVLAVDRAVRYVEYGADLINVLPPWQLGPDRAAVRSHLEALLTAIAPTPLVVQVAPAQTGTSLDADTLAQLREAHPNLVQVKVEAVPPGRMIASLAATGTPLTSIVGYAGLQLPDALRRGAVAVQPGCSFVELYLQVWRLWSEGARDEAVALHGRMTPYLSYWMQSVPLIIAVEKRISQLRGLLPTDICRAPGYRLDAEENALIDRFLLEFTNDLEHYNAPTDRAVAG